jgi:serine/threonine protein kinase
MQIYDAITHLHCHNIIHRDVKYENMTIDNGVVYLIDFGLACFEDSEDNKYTCGTFPYMPISAHLGIKRTFASDLESLGYCILALNSRKFRTLPLKELHAYKQDFINRQQYEETSIFHKIQTYLKYTLDPLAT